MEATEKTSSGDLLKFSAAVQITRPKSAATSYQGFSPSQNSPKQMKVTQLVLKKSVEQSPNVKISHSRKEFIIDKKDTATKTEDHKTNILEGHSMLSSSLNVRSELAMTSTTSQTQRKKVEKIENEKSITTNAKQLKRSKTTGFVVVADESPPHNHKSSSVNEAVRREAREFMKKQKEKRKQLETKKEEDDKSCIIKQRLEELKITTRNVIANKPLPSSSSKKANANTNSPHELSRQKSHPSLREIHTLKLKPMSGRSKNVRSSSASAIIVEMNKPQIDISTKTKRVVVEMEKESSEVEMEMKMEVNPKQATSAAASFPASPVKKSPQKKLVSPLQLQNHQLRTKKLDIAQQQPSPRRHKKSLAIEDMKLKIPDVKLNITPLSRHDIVPSQFKTKTPAWLQSSFTYPYPYNFIFAVKKKLEAYVTSTEQHKKKKQKKIQKKKKSNDGKQHKIVDDTEDMNTMSEISSIQSDLVLMRSQRSNNHDDRNEVGGDHDEGEDDNEDEDDDDDDEDDETTISISTLNEVKNDDGFIGKKRESVNSEFDRASFPIKNDVELTLEDISPNTSEKQENFLSSTKIEQPPPPPLFQRKEMMIHDDDTFKKPDLPVLKKPQVPQSENDDNNHNSNDSTMMKENDYRKMLDEFQQSLSQVIEVNNQLSSSFINSKTSSIKSYSSVFEEKTLDDGEDMVEEQREQQQTAKNQEISNDDRELGESSSIQTFIESETLKEKIISDPPLIVKSHYKDFQNNETSSLLTSVTPTTMTTNKDELKEQLDNTLNESKILNILKISDINSSFSNTNIISFNNDLKNVENLELLFNKSTKEINTWEKKLIDRMKGEIAWLELKKQNLKKHGHYEKAALMRNLQRTLLLKLEKEREKLKNASYNSQLIESSSTTTMENDENNDESNNENAIEKILEQRENKLNLKRKQIERLIKWQQKLDQEEEKLKKIEQQLLGKSVKKLSSSKIAVKESENDLNMSIEKVKSIDKSLEILHNIPSSEEKPETVKVSGLKLNKLWRRLTGTSCTKFNSDEIFIYSKNDFSNLYEDARQFVLQNNFENVLDVSILSTKDEEKIINEDEDEKSEVSTMNSIANIETEEEYPGSFQAESELIVTSSTPNNTKPNQIIEIEIPKLDNNNLTFAVHTTSKIKPIEDLNQSNFSVGTCEMEVENDEKSISFVDSFEKYDNSSVAADGSIIPEVININTNIINNIQITDMDDSNDQDQMIEDISFPIDFETSLSIRDSENGDDDDNNKNNLSTITECTEYEQSQGSSEIYTDYGTTSTSSNSESKNIEIQNRLISISESLNEVNDVFDRAAVVKPLSWSQTKSNSFETSSENTIQFSEHDVVLPSTQEDKNPKSNISSSSDDSTSDF